MKRFAINDYGSAAAVFQEISAQQRELTAGHVRIAVKAFAVNPYDISLRKGALKEVRTLKFPYVLGNDGVGIVTEIASDVNNVQVGDAVIVHAVGGMYGEEIVVPAKKVALKPPKMHWDQAAGLATPGITAYNLLYHAVDLSQFETVLVQGASGAVGSLLVQLLKNADKTVYATASSRNRALVESFGSDHFAAYDQEDVSKLWHDRADLVIDATRGSRSFNSGVQVLKEGGTYVALNELPAAEKRLKMGNYHHFAPQKEYQDQEAYQTLLPLVEEKRLQVTIAKVLPFELASVIAAHEELEGHPPAGKIIIEKD